MVQKKVMYLIGLILLAFDIHADNLERGIVFLEMKGEAEGLGFTLVAGDGEGTVLVFLALENEFEIGDGVLAEKIFQYMRSLLVAVDAFLAQNGDQQLIIAHFGHSVGIFFHEGGFNLRIRYIGRRSEGHHHERKDSKYKFHTPKLAKIIP